MSTGGFSSILKLTDLDDFIGPSQECIKPVQKPEPPRQEQEQSGSSSISKIKIQLDDDGMYNQIRDNVKEPLQKVSVTLSDCLACSGCITSAESVLISQQGPEELLKVLNRNKSLKESALEDTSMLCIVSLGVQAVLSLAEKFHLEPQEAAERLAGLFIFLGADKVTTTTLGENLSLIESRNEFIRHFETQRANNEKITPILSGICPGWVCYAEKLHGHSLPYISGVKSAQQIMGSLLKLVYSSKCNHSPDEIYHISVMSCFDRKLESSREDFYLKDYRTKEVDSVITPVEIEQMLEMLGKHLTDFDRHNLENLFAIDSSESRTRSYPLMSHYGSGSGGYAEFILRSVTKLWGNTIIDEVTWNQGRNPDIWEATVNVGNDVLRFCIATGFRNIQTLVRKLKTKSLATQLPHYIEIMACPTGCMNGGAQSRPNEAMTEKNQSRELSFKLLEKYRTLALAAEEDSDVKSVLEVLGSSDSQAYQTTLYTQFHAIEKLPSLGIKW